MSEISSERTCHTGETEPERINRNFHELLQELRVAQAGVQILFAFLLTLPFSARFGDVDTFDRGVYLVTLVSSACAAALLIAPVSYHRMVFRRGMKRRVVLAADRLAQGGLAFLLVAMVGAVLLVVDFVVGRTEGAIVAGAMALWFVIFWYVIPSRTRWETNGEPDDPGR